MFDKFDLNFLNENLVSRKNWRPCAPLTDRAWWEDIRHHKGGESLIQAGVILLNDTWLPLKASDYIRFTSGDGNRTVYEEVYFKRRDSLWVLTVAECLENQGRFLNLITDLLWLIYEETSWCLPAHNKSRRGLQPGHGQGQLPLPEQNEPIVDLFAAETSAMISYVLFLLKNPLDQITPQIVERGEREIEIRVLTPFYTRLDFGWMGLAKYPDQRINNWTPWICSNILATELLQDKDGNRRTYMVHKVIQCINEFIKIYPRDGGCDEGPGYWVRAGASFFDCLEFLFESTKGKLDLYGNNLIKNMGSYIYKVFIDRNGYVNFADAPALVNMPGDLLMKYGKRIGDENMINLGLYAETIRRDQEPAGEVHRENPYRWFRFHEADFTRCESAEPPRLKSAFLPELKVVTARTSAAGPQGFFLALKGGHNDESHNHNDVGQLILYRNGQGVLIDAGVGDYTRKTFSSERYDIWTMQSAYHNLPTINGYQQLAGEEYCSSDVEFKDDGSLLDASLDMAGAYPADAALDSLVRRVHFDRKADRVELTDTYSLVASRTQNNPTISWSFLLPGKPRKAGNILFLNEGVRLIFDESLSMKCEEIEIDPHDKKLYSSWKANLYRVILTRKDGGLKGKVSFTFLG